MAQKPDGKPARTERVTFTKNASERIARAVRRVEAGNRDAKGISFGVRLQGGGTKVFRICTFTGTWSINQTKTVTFKNQTNTPNTVSAENIFAGLSGCDVFVARDGTAWYAVGANLTQQAGYSTATIQLIGHGTSDSKELTWYSITTCA